MFIQVGKSFKYSEIAALDQCESSIGRERMRSLFLISVLGLLVPSERHVGGQDPVPPTPVQGDGDTLLSGDITPLSMLEYIHANRYHNNITMGMAELMDITMVIAELMDKHDKDMAQIDDLRTEMVDLRAEMARIKGQPEIEVGGKKCGENHLSWVSQPRCRQNLAGLGAKLVLYSHIS